MMGEEAMTMHDPAQHDHDVRAEGSFWTSRAFLVCAGLLLIVGFLLWTEHLAHALGYLPFLLILACPLAHMFMHGGHGGHQHHGHARRDAQAEGDNL
jgi:hypothetical protein